MDDRSDVPGEPQRVWDPAAGRYVAPEELVPTSDEAETTPPEGIAADPGPEPAPPIEPPGAVAPAAAPSASPPWATAVLAAVIGAVVALAVVVFVPGDDAPTPVDEDEQALATSDVVTGLRQVVVSVSGDEDARGRRPSGSGVVLSEDGTVVTSARLVEGQERLAVAFASGRLATAKVVGRDPFWDLAFLDVEFEDLRALPRSSAAFVRAGDDVVAIGSPAQTYTSVGRGVVSAVAQPFEDSAGDTRFDVVRVSGDTLATGSLVANLGGEAIGLRTGIRDASDGGGYVLPIDVVWSAFDRIVVRNAEATHPWIGLVTTPIGPEAGVLGDARGLLVVLVFRDGPAADAGLRPGDFVVAVDDREAEASLLVLSRILDHGVGGKVEVAYLRNGDLRNVDIEVAEQPSARPDDQE